MKYLKVNWIHDLDDEPSLLYSEIDENRYEIRKIEVYKDESFGLATATYEFGGTRLGFEPIPEIDKIKEDLQFIPTYITKEEFEIEWVRYLNYL